MSISGKSLIDPGKDAGNTTSSAVQKTLQEKHGIEMLFTVMGPGCETVTWQEDGLVNGVWKDGRIGTFGKGPNVVEVTGTKDTTQCGGGNYGGLLTAMCTFFETGEPPVQPEETINLFAFIVAAQKSKDNGNVPVHIRDVMAEASDAIAERNKGNSN